MRNSRSARRLTAAKRECCKYLALEKLEKERQCEVRRAVFSNIEGNFVIDFSISWIRIQVTIARHRHRVDLDCDERRTTVINHQLIQKRLVLVRWPARETTTAQ